MIGGELMWEPRIDFLEEGRVQKVVIRHGGKELCYADAIAGWRHDRAFRACFMSLLADAPFSAFFWETPPVTKSTLDRVFEFVLVSSPQLTGVHPNLHAFQSHFESAHDNAEIVVFPSLGKDAFLVVPCPLESPSVYAHIASFTREAPVHQQHALWQKVGETMARRLDARPTWLSTSGLGVFWLHVRLDSRPKYYCYRPYRSWE